MEVKFNPKVNGNGLFATKSYDAGSVVFTLTGIVTDYPTKYTIHIGNDKHILDEWGSFMNHSFDPSTKIVGSQVIAERNINPGDELNFNYNASEVAMAAPFQLDGVWVAGNSTH